ncbi:phosphotransferase system HPr (HPr) family protein [Bradyrhizobium sp. JR4.1]|uniref:HPr family phosphocarrier protein n=1 Tax=Bradyrhizobium sp. JR4.1 TaxID=3156372 RepID=UPI0033921DF1
MIFEIIGQQLASFGTKKAFELVLDALNGVINNERAFNFAQEELREEYEERLLPASYEHVVTNLRLTRNDFVQYFRSKPTQSLVDHLRKQLWKRSESWVYNRPEDGVFGSLVDGFLDAYQRYFLSNDPLLATLGVAETSKEILQTVMEIRESLRASQTTAATDVSRKAHPLSISREVRSFLTVLNIPFEIIEERSDKIDIMVIDPSSVFPNRFILCVRTRVDRLEDIDAIVELSKAHTSVSNVLLVSVAPITYQIAESAERRRISVNSFEEFKESFFKLSPLERYVVGSLASRALAESLNVHDIYIAPDAIPVVPGDQMEQRFFDTRDPAKQLVETFIEDETANILFVLGAYGSGKSAFCAYLMHNLQQKNVMPVYFALRQLRHADDLPKIVTKAEQLAKTLGDGTQRALIILDGLDELPNAMNGEQKKQNMLRILEAATRADKLLITARTSYFRGIEDFWLLFRRPQDSSIWNEMAKFIPEGGRRPSVGAIILREFNTDQIETYIQKFAESHQLEKSFANDFLSQMKSHDFGFNYLMLARSPLYLFLLAHSRPWASRDVRCLADVFSLFVRYWLERDIEKGRSRWAFTTDDRLDFMEEIAWKMFQERRHALTFAEFDGCVRTFIGPGAKDDDYISLALDLQTTGIFNSFGNIIQFFAPGFLDFFVVQRFVYERFGEIKPNRLPSIDQASMWAGLAETHQRGVKSASGKYLESIGVQNLSEFTGAISLDPGRIIYHLPCNDWNWPFLNSIHDYHKDDPRHSPTNVRIIINAVLNRVEADTWAEIRVCVANRRGLHARASAKVCQSYEKWMEDFVGRETPIVTARRGEESVGLNSIMGLMMLAAGPGTTIVIEYSKCTRGEVEVLLERIGCQRSGEPGLWWGDFDNPLPAMCDSDALVEPFNPRRT